VIVGIFSTFYLTLAWVRPTVSPTFSLEQKISSSFDDACQRPRKIKGDATIVTAYFPLDSKHSPEDYDLWMSNMLSLQDSMVIFTTSDYAAKIKGLRAHMLNKTIVVVIEMNEMLMATAYDEDFWEFQHNIDPEAQTHPNFRIYWIWNEKANFLKRALDMNPFNSEFFAWVDIGYFRTAEYNRQRMLTVVPRDMRRGQLLMLNVSSLIEASYGKYVGGGFIGGFKEGICEWYTEYYEMLESQKNTFIGKDQPTMWQTCSKNPGLCLLIEPTINMHGDPWFFMTSFLIEYLASESTDWNEYRLGDVFKHRPDAMACELFPCSLACAYKQQSIRPSDLETLIETIDQYPVKKKPPTNAAVLHLRLGDGLCAKNDTKCRSSGPGPSCWLRDQDCWIDYDNGILRYTYSEHWYESVVSSLAPYKLIVLVSDDNHWTRTLPDPRGKDRSIGNTYREMAKAFFRKHGFDVVEHETSLPDDDFTFMTAAPVFVRGGGGYSGLVASIVEARGGIVIEPKPVLAKVSVIVPAITEDLSVNLPRLLLSIDKQVVQPEEVIIVLSGVDEDDCIRAREGDASDARKFLLRIECKASLVNQATARNVGMELAQGEWYSFIDADDEMSPIRLATIYSYVKEFPELRLFLHGLSRSHEDAVGKFSDYTTHIRGEELYDLEEHTRPLHDWILASMMHSMPTINSDVPVRFQTGDEMFRKEDSFFVRDVIQYLGRVEDRMIFDPSPLGVHTPRELQPGLWGKLGGGLCFVAIMFCLSWAAGKLYAAKRERK